MKNVIQFLFSWWKGSIHNGYRLTCPTSDQVWCALSVQVTQDLPCENTIYPAAYIHVQKVVGDSHCCSICTYCIQTRCHGCRDIWWPGFWSCWDKTVFVLKEKTTAAANRFVWQKVTPSSYHTALSFVITFSEKSYWQSSCVCIAIPVGSLCLVLSVHDQTGPYLHVRAS